MKTIKLLRTIMGDTGEEFGLDRGAVFNVMEENPKATLIEIRYWIVAKNGEKVGLYENEVEVIKDDTPMRLRGK